MMGAKVISSNNEKLPITIKGPKEVFPLNYSSKISSAQIKSSILLSGLAASGKTVFKEPNESRNHTEKMMKFLKLLSPIIEMGFLYTFFGSLV